MTSITNLRNLSDTAVFNIPDIGTVPAIGGRRLGLSTLLFATLISTSPVRADWLDDVWNDEHSSRHGPVAITIHAVNGITIVLPEASINEAQAAGVSPQQAALAFLRKYGPEMCSPIIDLNENKPALTIKLIVQYMHSSGRNIVFEASSHEEVWTIDYIPTHRARCVAPPDDDVAGTRDSVFPRVVPKNGI
jgi:hypothetical protein